ncbi:unnamed protein product [Heterobilharzia americana]|nr:unnamed protein product [Heterobilharzia americana]
MGYSEAKPRKSIRSSIETNVSAKKLKVTKNGKKFYRSNITLCVIVFLMAVTAGYLHWYHVSNLHENDLFFSHLSNMEREMTFRTEMGFYYSYFKQIVLAPTFVDGFNSLLNDTRTEYPACLNLTGNTDIQQDSSCPSLNAIERFNLYPELLLAGAYRFLKSFGLLKSYCFQVKRDPPIDSIAIAVDHNVLKNSSQLRRLDALPTNHLKITGKSIISCDGSGELPYFYVNTVFILSGLILFSLTYSGWLVARIGSHNRSRTELLIPLFGAFLPVLAYFSNHREATRVQWTPPLRENFAYPFFVLQQSFLFGQFGSYEMLPSSRIRSFISSVLYCIVLLSFQLPWQFAQFTLLTQIVSIICSFCLTLSSMPPNDVEKKSIILNLLSKVKRILWMHLVVFSVSYILQYGNRLLLQSGYLFCLLSGLFTMYILQRMVETFNSMVNKENEFSTFSSIIHIPFIRFLCLPVIINCISVFGLSVVFSIFLSYKTFHTMLYVCAPEFDFITWAALKQPFETGLLCGSILVCLIVCFKPIKNLFSPHDSSTSVHTRLLDTDNHLYYGYSFSIFREFVSFLVVSQMLAFTVMAVLIMRLKLFWTPQMCLSLAILAQSTRWFEIFHTLRSFFGRIFREQPSNNFRKSDNKVNGQSGLVYVIYTVLVMFIAFMGGRGLKISSLNGTYRAHSVLMKMKY